MTPARVLALLSLAVCCAPSVAHAQRKPVTTPEQALGQRVGADRFLATYTQLAKYWRQLANESDRMELERIGTTAYGQPMLLAVISSPQNLARREELRGIANRLCRARGLTDSQARELVRKGRAIVWIDAGMHATESVAAQNILELVYQMCARDDEEVRRILDNVVLLVCPANPDGMEMIASAYSATGVVGRIPVLYQRYCGHDNNRDYYACNMVETQAISHALYTRWTPQILYNHHQSAPRGTVIFTPPFRDPFNYNYDPLVVRGVELVSAHMTSRFATEGKAGVISRSGASYSTWWNGGLRTTAYFHNVIGILTETFGRPEPTELRQSIGRRLPYGDYPQPIATQTWHARQSIDYLQCANFAILDLASRYGSELLFNFYQMGRNSIRRGSQDHWTPTPKLIAEARRRAGRARGGDGDAADNGGRGGRGRDRGLEAAVAEVFADPELRDPRGYVLPADQPDVTAAVRMVDALRATGVEVHRATRSFKIGDKIYPAGSFVVRCAQAYRPHVRDMFEPQWHPDDVGSSGEPVRPYDAAGWTLALQLGVRFDRILEGFDGPFELIDGDTPRPAGAVRAGEAGYVLARSDLGSFRCINRLWAFGEKLALVGRASQSNGQRVAVGDVFIARGEQTEARVRELAKELGVDFVGVDTRPGRLRPLQRPRIGLFDVYGGNMATGWTRWALEQFEFPVELVTGKRVHAGDLGRDYDVLVFHTGLPAPRDSQRVQRALRRGRPTQLRPEQLDKMIEALPPFEDWSTMADRVERLTRDKALPQLRKFVEAGGRIVAVGSQATAIAKHFELPIREGAYVEVEGERKRVTQKQLFIPGSLLQLDLDDAHPLAAGSPERIAAMFRRSPLFAVEAGAEGVEVVARYAGDGDLLLSGWAIGEEHVRGKAAILTAAVGKGRVHLFGIEAMYRGQPYTTFRLFFNALLQ